MMVKVTHGFEGDGEVLAFRNDYPEHCTQGEDLADLKEHPRDLHLMFSGDPIEGIRKGFELEVEAA